ncbi:MAG: carboxymuconolactone decarboxylase family protein [Maricaulaceae bacterium]
MIASRSTFNIYTTLAHHVDLYNHWSPFGRIILNNDTVPPRHREMIMLRTGWLCQSEYEFAQHARIATGEAVGMTPAEIDAIAAGPDAPNWTAFESTLLRMVDELRYDAMISDATWAALEEEYTDEQIVTAIFIAGQYQLVSMALNSLGVQLDEGLEFRLPDGHPLPGPAGRPNAARLTTPRIAPLRAEDVDPAQPEIVSRLTGGEVLNLFATMVRYPQLAGTMNGFLTYLLGEEARLSAADRELVILRTAWNTNTPYEWAHHAPLALQVGLTEAQIAAIPQGVGADIWDERQVASLTAADELRAQAFITDPTWARLEAHYDTQEMIEIIYAVGGYSLAGLAMNSLGIQVEAGYTEYLID